MQRTNKRVYTPERVKGLVEYLLNNTLHKLEDSFHFLQRMVSRRSLNRIDRARKDLFQRVSLTSNRNVRVRDGKLIWEIEDYSQEQLDKLYRWLMHHKVGQEKDRDRFRIGNKLFWKLSYNRKYRRFIRI